MVETLRKLRAILDPRQRRRWLRLVPLAVAVAGLEALGAVAVLAMIQMLVNPEQAGRNPLVSRALALTDRASIDDLIIPFAVGVAIFTLAKNGMRLGETHLRQLCVERSTVALSTELMRRYLAAPYEFHLSRNSARQIRNALSAVDSVVARILVSLAAAVSEVCVILGILGVVIRAAPPSALLAGALTAALMGLVLRLTQLHHERWGARAHALNAGLLGNLQESMGGVKEIQILGREAHFVGRFALFRGALSRVVRRRTTLQMVPRLAVETLFVVGVASVVVVARLQGTPNLVPILGLFAYAGMRILPSLHWTIFHANEIRFGRAALDTLYADWESLVERADAGPVAAPLPFEDRIRFEDVSFSYENSTRPALSAVRLTIHHGESIGIVGPTGAGKSTLVDLLLGLLVPSEGRIRVDGRDIREVRRAWQAQIGYVPQDVFLSDDTLRRNVALGLDDADIDEARVWEVLRTAQLDEFARGLPMGLDARVGERGVRLSGGERQRVAVARSLYRDPAVLVFDEATAALDGETEQALARAIEGLQRKKTLVIIAHRLTTVRHCDRLVFLRGGRVADTGPFHELESRNPEFRSLIAGSYLTD